MDPLSDKFARNFDSFAADIKVHITGSILKDSAPLYALTLDLDCNSPSFPPNAGRRSQKLGSSIAIVYLPSAWK